MATKHILRAQQFSPDLLEELFARTDQLIATGPINLPLRGQTACIIFYEPSTRTRLSFTIGAQQLGMYTVETENAGQFSSAVKGETLEDTIRVLREYQPRVIVLRHNDVGAADRAAAVSGPVSIINAGDGGGQHPTQALLDLYTIRRHFGHHLGLTVVIGGDLAHGRTARSLAYLLAKFGSRLIFVSPPSLAIGQDIKNHLTEHGAEFEETTNLSLACRQAQVVYWTRIQKERLVDPTLYDQVRGQYQITPKVLGQMPENSILLHPLPRVDEISPECDQDPRAMYFKQAGYGLPLRMALLEYVSGN